MNKNKGQIYSLIGMSGVGKSYWSDKLEKTGFTVYHIDDIIAIKLKSVVKKFSIKNDINYSKSSVGDLAKWMGFPDDERYKKNSKTYLDMETKVVKEVLNKAKKSRKNVVIDTTGSVIYIDSEISKELKKLTKVIYFDAGTKHLKSMFEEFKRNPKPIIWGNMYKPKKGENENKALLRCYKQLIDSRIKKYNKLSKQKIDYKWLRDKKRKVEDLLQKIK